MWLFPVLAFEEVMFLNKHFSWTGVLLAERSLGSCKASFPSFFSLFALMLGTKTAAGKQMGT